ncbi:hypothetical protein HYV80_06085 [Candidatus Woesearchaeota archaeon]|nr:hypothetical protein [Candidatus Woesearchaeota archaeon]
MIKVKKTFSLLITIFVIFGNIAFAQYSDSSGPSSYGGRPIDPSKEGKEYYREGDTIVYPARQGSDENEMMERFIKSGMSEEEMRKAAREKFGKDFDEMEFEKGMMEVNERMARKGAFSYENEGYERRSYAGPSYEGYSKEQMVFSLVFQHIGDEIDPREIKQHCNEPEKIADMVIIKLKEKIGDLQNICNQAEEQELKCNEMSKRMCLQIGTPYARDDATELEKLHSVAYACPVNKEAIVKACKLRSKTNIEQQMKHMDESCEKRFEQEGERLLAECGRFKQSQICDKGKHMERCMGGIKKEDFEKPICPDSPVPKCSEGARILTKTDAKGCAYHYCETAYTCPVQAVPTCRENEAMQKRADDKGCVNYHCEASTAACPADAQQCPDGSYAARDPNNNCNFKPCQEIKCREPTTPICASGQILQKKADGNGCVYYYCEQMPCAEIAKPACAEGQSLTAKYDENKCVASYECVSVTTSASITGSVIAGTYDDRIRNCENSWREQERACASMLESCDKSSLIEKCRQQSRRNFEEHSSKIGQQCELYTVSEIRAAEDRCSRMDKERERCFSESAKRCEHTKGIAEKCRESLTEENLRKFIAEESKKRCKFKDILADEDDVRASDKVEIVLAVLNTATEDDVSKLELFIDGLKEDLKLQDTTVYKGMINPNNFNDIKLLPFVVNAKISAVAGSERAKDAKAKIVAGQKAEEAAGRLASLRDSDVPDEYLYIIENQANDVLDVSDNLKEIEKKEDGKGLGYKIRLFLGLAKAAEQEEIRQLDESKAKLKGSIEALAKLADEVPSDVAKSILKEQVDNLKKQHDDIEVLIDAKEKKAKGLLGLFG